jgi:hypothetical protein
VGGPELDRFIVKLSAAHSEPRWRLLTGASYKHVTPVGVMIIVGGHYASLLVVDNPNSRFVVDYDQTHASG